MTNIYRESKHIYYCIVETEFLTVVSTAGPFEVGSKDLWNVIKPPIYTSLQPSQPSFHCVVHK